MQDENLKVIKACIEGGKNGETLQLKKLLSDCELRELENPRFFVSNIRIK